jgi:hypothetical protein
MPVLDLSQHRFDIFEDRARAQAGVGDRNQGRRDLVSKISPGFDLVREVGVEADFAAAHFSLLEKDDGLIRVVRVVFRVDYGMNPAARRSSEEAS